jgi:hypothetical protein
MWDPQNRFLFLFFFLLQRVNDEAISCQTDSFCCYRLNVSSTILNHNVPLMLEIHTYYVKGIVRIGYMSDCG